MTDEPRPRPETISFQSELLRQMNERAAEEILEHEAAVLSTLAVPARFMPPLRHGPDSAGGHTLDSAAYATHAVRSTLSAYGVSPLHSIRRELAQAAELERLIKGVVVNDTQVPEQANAVPEPHPDLLEHTEELCKAYDLPLDDSRRMRRVITELAANLMLDAVKIAQINARLRNYGPDDKMIELEEIDLADTLRYLLEKVLVMSSVFDFTHIFDLTPGAIERHAGERHTTPWVKDGSSED